MAIRCRLAVAVAVVALAVGEAACGSSTNRAGAPGPVPQHVRPYTKQDVIRAAGLRADDKTGLAYHTKSGCQISVIMTSKPEVDLYAGAGDDVASNPGRTAGVKFYGGDAWCYGQLTRGLAKLK